ncbi:MAG: peptidyl-prolyl cis-trans isomerase, partial [Polyangiaceae bacterium]|nr:peptidyl-prolyl cis-trans isomerase [Polyangiaceae bacterium]
MPNRRYPSLACTALAALGCSLALVALPACNDKALELPPDAGAVPEGLTAEQAAAVVAKVGDRTITLGDVAAHIGSLNPYYRLRFQSKELRRKLVDEMIDVELLAIEARRLGLDKDPRTEEAIRQVLRDAMLAEARKDVPDPSAFSAAEVRAYYEANRDRFREPERRRVAAIVLAKREDAEKVLAQALEDKSAEAWGKLYLA